MVKARYAICVAALSFEALLLSCALAAWVACETEIGSLVKSLAVNDELLKYLLVLPLGIGAWIVNESRALLQEDKETTRILTSWPDYWRLKMHIWVALSYALLFALMSIAPWTVKAGITTAAGFLMFLTSIVGQFLVALSIYVARIRLKEILVHADAA